MVVVLIVIIALLLVAIVYLNMEIYKEKKVFRHKLAALHNLIVEIRKKQSGQNQQIQLSKELDESLKTSNATLNNAIFGLNYELFDILSKNNGLNK